MRDKRLRTEPCCQLSPASQTLFVLLRDGNNDGGNNDGGVVVHGRSEAVPLLAGTASILCLVLSLAVREVMFT